MARAQTYIVDPSDKIYAYSSDSHDVNHYNHLENKCKNLEVTEFIPFMLMKQKTCVIDIEKHIKTGCMYLPNNPTNFQRQWIIERGFYFDKISWQLAEVTEIENKIKIQDNVSFSKIRVKLKK